jgi:tRNA(Ile)-lysidine synthase
MGGHLPPVVASARNAVRAALRQRPAPPGAQPFVLVGCSGGADSLALAAATAFWARKGEVRAGAVVVDHQLQPGSAAVAAAAAEQLRALGLEPVLVRRVQPRDATEDAARSARYGAFERALADTGAQVLLLGHTLDDQAEQVLLGLVRGSGTRSLAGIPPQRGPYLRPLLGMRRRDTEAICAHEGLEYWSDPTNDDTGPLRNRIRSRVLPLLERELGPGIAQSLARTAGVCRDDADYLEAAARRALAELAVVPPGSGEIGQASGATGTGQTPAAEAMLDLDGLRALEPALLGRVLRDAVVQLGGKGPGFERIAALRALVHGSMSAGPVQLEGNVAAVRRRAAAAGRRAVLVLRRTAG